MSKPRPTFTQLAPMYRRLWDTMELDPGAQSAIEVAARKVLAGRSRYEAVARRCGPRVPWDVIGVTHLMEADCRFDRHPHNGNKLTAQTHEVPAGRPPNPSRYPIPWEESAIDCYAVLKKFGDIPDWSVERTLYTAEFFNGPGYLMYHADENTPYLWAKTNHNDGHGKYVADGRFDENAPSEGQCGFAPVLREIRRITGESFDASPASPGLAIGDSGWEVEALQRRLSELGYAVGRVDGSFGRQTRAAVLDFQARHGLSPTGTVDAATKAALGSAEKRDVAPERAAATADDLRQAGSTTVAKADKVSLWGKILAGLGLGGAAADGSDSTGLSDTLGRITDNMDAVKAVARSLAGLGHWALAHWWLVLIAVGVAYWLWGRDIIAARLADHRSGANLGR